MGRDEAAHRQRPGVSSSLPQRQRYDDQRHRRHNDYDRPRDNGYPQRAPREDLSDKRVASRWAEADSSSASHRRSDLTRRDDHARDSRHAERSRRRSRSPDASNFAAERAREREAYDQRYGTDPSRDATGDDDKEPSMEPDFGASGLLAKESNSKNGVTLKYFEPPEARKPKRKWRLYVFKDGKEVDLMHISRQSCYLIGRDQTVVDIPVDHTSISKQHAVIQYRSMTERNEFGDEKKAIKPFLIDLDSANGCSVNGRDIPPSRYYELRQGDTIRLGGSSREYVLLAEE